MVTFHACQQSCPITLSHGWQSSDILAPVERLFLVDCSLNKSQLAKEAVLSVPAGAGERLAWGYHGQGAGWGPQLTSPKWGQAFVTQPLSDRSLALCGAGSLVETLQPHLRRLFGTGLATP